jgi:hypothetical protein
MPLPQEKAFHNSTPPNPDAPDIAAAKKPPVNNEPIS